MFDCGFVVYSNGAKQAMLGVSAAILDRDGAVSRRRAEAMAEGALAHVARRHRGCRHRDRRTGRRLGGEAGRPRAFRRRRARHGPRIHREVRFGDIGRGPVRMQSVAEALAMIEALVGATS